MIPLRIGFDMDGTLADLSSAYAEVEDRLFGQEQAEHERPAPEAREAEQHEEDAPAAATIGDNRRTSNDVHRTRRGTSHRDRVWQAIEETPNFWTTLKPLENGRRQRLYQLTCEHNWEVFFITQRPATAGATVQWQTHKWLIEQGFSTPSVIPLSGGRGKCAAALHLDYLIDDTPQNCVDVLVGFVDPRASFSSIATIRLPRAARGVSASAPRATFTRCSICCSGHRSARQPLAVRKTPKTRRLEVTDSEIH